MTKWKNIAASKVDCPYCVYTGVYMNSEDNYACQLSEDFNCEQFNNPDDCCMYRELAWYKDRVQQLEDEVACLDQEAQELLNDKLKLEDLVKELRNER